MKVIVTGATGFLGRYAMAALSATGCDVLGLSSKDFDISKPLPKKYFADCVVHLAAYNITSVGEQDEEAYFKANVLGTRHVLEGIECKRFVFLSTIKVDGVNLKGYAKSKALAEEECLKLSSSREMVIVRAANILGPGQAPKAILPVFLSKARAGVPLQLSVDPGSPLAYISACDMGELLSRCARGGSRRGVYYAAYPETVTIGDLAVKVVAATGSSSTIQIAPNAQYMALPVFDCAKTWEDFGFQPRLGIDQIIATMANTT